MGTAEEMRSERHLHGVLRALPPEEPLLVQEKLSGPLGSLALVVARDGRLVARFQHSVKRTSRLGTTIVARSVAPEERLAERAARVLGDSGYFGLAQLDYFDTPAGRRSSTSILASPGRCRSPARPGSTSRSRGSRS